MLSRTEHVRRVLQKSFDLPAAEVVGRLANKGVEIESGLVHVVRSTMRKEQQLAEEQRLSEIEEEKAKLKAMAARVQATKALNPKPLREHIMIALGGGNSGATYQEIVDSCKRGGYKMPDNSPESNEAFRQNVRKTLRLLVLDGTIDKKKDKFMAKQWSLVAKRQSEQKVSIQPPPKQVDHLDLGVRRQEVIAGTENGIAFLVGKLKNIVAKIGKNEAKELIDIL